MADDTIAQYRFARRMGLVIKARIESAGTLKFDDDFLILSTDRNARVVDRGRITANVRELKSLKG